MEERKSYVEKYAEERSSSRSEYNLNPLDPLDNTKYTLESLKDKIYQFTTVSFNISYLALGALQFFATWAGMFEYFHNNFIIVFFVSSFVSFIPLVGTGFGIYGAHVGWGWNLPLSIALFAGPYVIIGGLVLVAGLIDFIISNRRKSNY